MKNAASALAAWAIHSKIKRHMETIASVNVDSGTQRRVLSEAGFYVALYVAGFLCSFSIAYLPVAFLSASLWP